MPEQNSKQRKSNCFYITLELMRDEFFEQKVIHNLILGKYPSLSDESLKEQPLLVHGYVQSFSGKRIKHAWIESNGYVIEYSGSNRLVELKRDYYRKNHATSVAQFSSETALDFLTKGYAVGFWRRPEEVRKVEHAPNFESLREFDFAELYLKDGHRE